MPDVTVEVKQGNPIDVTIATGYPITASPEPDKQIIVNPSSGGSVTVSPETPSVNIALDAEVDPVWNAQKNNYYTKTESDDRYAVVNHTHDDRYYTETESDARYLKLNQTTPQTVINGTPQFNVGINFYSGYTSSVFATFNGPASAPGLWIKDSGTLWFGSGSGGNPDMRIRYNTADANANYLAWGLPAGGAVDVPVLTYGLDASTYSDLGLFNGITVPSLAILNSASNAYLMLQAGVIKDSSGAISFDNENLSTTGTVNAGNYKISNIIILHNYGTDNIFVGANAGNESMTGGGGNTGVGSYALYGNTSGTSNVAIGFSAMWQNTSGVQNTAVGLGALSSNTTAHYNTAVGMESLKNNSTGYNNTAVGTDSMYSTIDGFMNTAVGMEALYRNTIGDKNVAIGESAGRDIVTGDSNTFIGYEAGHNASQLTSAVNSTGIGAGAYTTASNQIVLGNISVTQIQCNSANIITTGTLGAGATTLTGNLILGANTITTSAATRVDNLNADSVDSKHVGSSGNTVPLLDGTNTWSGGNAFGGSFLQLPVGANVVISSDGYVTVDTTNDMFCYYSAATRVLYYKQTRSVVIYTDGDWNSEEIPIMDFPDVACTITAIRSSVLGTGTPTITFNLEERPWGTDITTAGTNITSSAMTATAAGLETTSFSNAGMAAKCHLVLTTAGSGAASGTTQDVLVINVEYTIDRT